MKTKYLIAATAILGAVACTQDPNVARHTVEDYRTNDELRKEVFAQCVNDPGALGKSADCINAREAERLESIGSLRDLPPLGLDPNKKR